MKFIFIKIKKVKNENIINVLQPIMQACGFFGVIPLTFDQHNKKFRHDLVSLTTLYSVSWYLSLASWMAFNSYNDLMELGIVKNIMILWYHVLSLMLQINLLLSILYSCDKIINLAESIRSFDKFYLSVKFLQCRSSNSRLLWIIVLGVYLAIWIIMLIQGFPKSQPIVDLIFFEYPMRFKFFTTVSYLVFCKELHLRYEHVRLQICNCTSNASRIVTLRLLLSRLYDCTRGLENAYGVIWLIYVIHSGCVITWQLILVIDSRSINDIVVVHVLSVMQYAYLVPLVIVSQRLTDQNEMLLREIHRVSNNVMDGDSKFQLIYLLKLLRQQPIRITCCGIFNINIPFLVSCWNGISTIGIAMAQFAPQIRRVFDNRIK